MNFIIEFLLWLEVWPLRYFHKVDLFLPVFGVMFWFTATSLSEKGLKQLLSIVGYTVTLNFICILLGFVPVFWWAWGWNFAFIPVFSWWKPMLLIFAISLVSMIIAYNNGWDKEMDKYLITGFVAPVGCLDWPCTKFTTNLTYSSREAARDQEKALKAKAKAQPKVDPAPVKPAAAVIPDYMPRQMFIPVK